MIMMQGTYYKEWSSVLNREMEFKVYGSAGVPVLALPARGGRFFDCSWAANSSWENPRSFRSCRRRLAMRLDSAL